MFAIDSLRQLSIKFLMKEELSNFNFQRVFLTPFETIISNVKESSIKDLILSCIDNMILACSKNIRSGWKSIFAICESVARDTDVNVAEFAFQIVERLIGMCVSERSAVNLLECYYSWMLR